jgi:TrmH family RNA methyltransferase
MAEILRIESVDNPKVRDAARLRERRARKKSGRFLVEGEREIRRALEAGHTPSMLFVQAGDLARNDLLLRVVRSGCPVFSVSPAVYAKLALREGSGGLIGVFPIPAISTDSLRVGADSLVLAASGIEKPGNLGALLRSADAFGVDAFLVEGGTDLWNPNVVRASLGCLFTLPVVALATGELVPWLERSGLRIVAAVPSRGTAPEKVGLAAGVAIVIGSEDQGLDPHVLEKADVRVRIAMEGRADSLNVSVAAGILLYEARRQRRRIGP